MAERGQILVEGFSDQKVVQAILNEHERDLAFDVIYRKGHEGYPSLRESFETTLTKNLDIRGLGVVADADHDVAGRWRSLADVLRGAGYPGVPDTPDPAGLVLESHSSSMAELPRVGVWLMPDNQSAGMLESFITRMVPAGDVLWDLAERSVDECYDIDPRYPAAGSREAHCPKALIHTWLAWQTEPGKPLWQALLKPSLEPGVDHASFRAWLGRLWTVGSAQGT